MISKKILTVGAAVAAVGSSLVLAPAAEAATAPCPDDLWCLYRDAGYGGGEIPTPGTRGVLGGPDWDLTSSAINNTGKRVCLYSFDDGPTAYLTMEIQPYQDLPEFPAEANDTVDAYYSTTEAGCAPMTEF